MDCLRDRVIAMEHKLDTLRTRVTQVADLQDAQGIREDHRAILARLNEVEECATVHTLREFMSKICSLEAMFTGDDGGVIFDAIRACNRRIDCQKIAMDDIYARIRTQDWYHDISDQEEDEEMENLALRIDPLDDDFEAIHHTVEPCDNGLDPCHDHRFQRMTHGHRRMQIGLLKCPQK